MLISIYNMLKEDETGNEFEGWPDGWSADNEGDWMEPGYDWLDDEYDGNDAFEEVGLYLV